MPHRAAARSTAITRNPYRFLPVIPIVESDRAGFQTCPQTHTWMTKHKRVREIGNW